jgi:outer membrane lipoprotein LolB
LTRIFAWQRYWLILLLCTVNACTTVPPKDTKPIDRTAFQARAGQLNTIVTWGLVGKISLDDGDRGGSGRLQWDVKPGHSALDFHGAMGRGAWHLQVGPEGARLQLADGSEQTAPGVNELIQEQIGWPIPLDALQWWVRGLAAPGVTENETLGPDGLLISLRQFGWSVDFNRYAAFDGMAMPVRLDAKRDNYRVKLAISRWRIGLDDAPAD